MNPKTIQKCSLRAESCGTPLSNRLSRIYIFTGSSEKTLLGWLIPTGFLSCVSPIKAKRDGRPYIFTVYETFETFYILLKRELRTKRFKLSYARSITFIKCFIFASLSNKYE